MLYAVLGLVVGIVMSAVAVWIIMPRKMLVVHRSRHHDVDTTCEALKRAIEETGWSCPGIRDMTDSMRKAGVDHGAEIRIVELCRADYADKVLRSHPRVATLMPCAFGVHKGTDGRVYISGMNTGLMGKMFGGVIAEVMGTSVARDERRILAAVSG
jgi:uncharacterized protein (DUF302 family)